jgi:hypothetical protein
MTKEIQLTQGKVALIDDDRYEVVVRHKWYAMKSRNTWYAGRTENGTTVFLHRFLINVPLDTFVDHIDGDGLNCTRNNMRLATRSQNGHNRKKTGGTSLYKGVSWISSRDCWFSQIKLNRKSYNLGYYKSEIDAAIAYNHAAREKHGDFAKYNDIPNWENIIPEKYYFPRENIKTKYIGVHSGGNGKTWMARIRYDGKQIYIGSSKDAKKAALMYDQVAREYYGEMMKTITLEDLQTIVRKTPLLERLSKCRDMIAGMCSEHHPPKMSIPVQWYDEDFYINLTLSDAESVLKRNARTCCYILDQADLSTGCLNLAVYQIWQGLTPDDYTESCAAHLELMLPDISHFHIERIETKVI